MTVRAFCPCACPALSLRLALPCWLGSWPLVLGGTSQEGTGQHRSAGVVKVRTDRHLQQRGLRGGGVVFIFSSCHFTFLSLVPSLTHAKVEEDFRPTDLMSLDLSLRYSSLVWANHLSLEVFLLLCPLAQGHQRQRKLPLGWGLGLASCCVLWGPDELYGVQQQLSP